jgi:hypothetical protein
MVNKSIMQLDNIMDLIQSMSLEFDTNVSHDHVYEEEWEFSNRVSRRISSFYGEIFDSYDYGLEDSAVQDFRSTLQSMDTMTLGRLKQFDSIARSEWDHQRSKTDELPQSAPVAVPNDHKRNTFQPDTPTSPRKAFPKEVHDCAFCQQAIESNAVLLMGRYWHKHHSQCAECKRPLGLDNFAEINDLLYCEDHYVTIRGKPVIKKDAKPKTDLDRELFELKSRSTVRKVRNLFTFEKTRRVNMLSVVEDELENKRQRYVVSWMAPNVEQ